jgi:sterol desaturase/sphingolipid hydroxylase (fatty acid hydroxylase superfamily)
LEPSLELVRQAGLKIVEAKRVFFGILHHIEAVPGPWVAFICSSHLIMRTTPDFVGALEPAISGVVAAVFVVLLILERRFLLRQAKRPKAQRFVTNVGVSALALATGAFIVAPIALRLASWNSESSFGLLRTVSLPFAAEFVLGFLLMDLTFYYWHRANHAFPFFWRFHNVHHVDPDLDVSTSFRFHFGEVFFSLGFKVLQIYLLGIRL